MTRSGGVVSPDPPRKSGRVSSPAPTSLVLFSFKFFRTDDGFELDSKECDRDWFNELLARLRAVSTMTPHEARVGGNKSLRAHQIDWARTTKDGFDLRDPDLASLPGYQFQIAKTKGRIHGIWIDFVFYIIWIDRHHRLYSDGH